MAMTFPHPHITGRHVPEHVLAAALAAIVFVAAGLGVWQYTDNSGSTSTAVAGTTQVSVAPQLDVPSPSAFDAASAMATAPGQATVSPALVERQALEAARADSVTPSASSAIPLGGGHPLAGEVRPSAAIIGGGHPLVGALGSSAPAIGGGHPLAGEVRPTVPATGDGHPFAVAAPPTTVTGGGHPGVLPG
ncbi:MAG: hypothetical protein ACR2P0_18765 [Acidimicrobiales bacterium]